MSGREETMDMPIGRLGGMRNRVSRDWCLRPHRFMNGTLLLVALFCLAAFDTRASYAPRGQVIGAAGGNMQASSFKTSSAVGQGQGIGFNSSLSLTHRGGFIQLEISFGNMHAPVLVPIGWKSVLAGNQLVFDVEATDGDGYPPSIEAEWLPGTASFLDAGNGSASFTWSPVSQNYGVHAVRFTASDGQFETSEVIRIYVGLAAESINTPSGLPGSLEGWSIQITDIDATPYASVSEISWDADSSVPYDVFASDDGTNWSKIASAVESPGDTASHDDVSFGSRIYRSYQVLFHGEVPATNAPAYTFARSDIPSGKFSLHGSPVQSDRRFDGDMGGALAEVLDGDDGGLGDQAGDEVYIRESSGEWQMLYLDGSGVWRDDFGNPSSHELEPGHGFIIRRHGSSSTQWSMFTSSEDNSSGVAVIQEGWNILSFAEGHPVNISTLLGEIASGGVSEADADLVVMLQNDGSWRRYMYVNGWGAPYDGKWFDLTSFQIVQITNQPGRAFYYFRKPGAGVANVEY